jgi:hypothetical protein
MFRRTCNHCGVWLTQADSLKEALVLYVTKHIAKITPEGRFRSDDGWGGDVFYDHPLECLEDNEKATDDRRYESGWHIAAFNPQCLDQAHVEILCSEDPYAIRGYAEMCRPLLHERYPASRALAFVWYLKAGPLVTFYQRKGHRHPWPHTILGRYLIREDNDFTPEAWHGTYDDILDELQLHFP